MRNPLLFLLSSIITFSASYGQSDLKTVFESTDYKETSTYEEGIAFYTALSQMSEQVSITAHGPTDSGLPLHLVLISSDKDFDINSNRLKGKSILLINNAIHPGEPDGVEASQMLARDIVTNKKLNKLLDNTLIAIIPFYNIGGALNRNTGSRTNQNGPTEKGFRGNARNYDLNRDFIKNDTYNSRSFSQIFQLLDPDVLIDTHVSNGADYQYVLSMVTPQSDKLGDPLKSYFDKKMMPSLYSKMQETAYEMTPYVNVWGSTPDKGWSQFFESARYSSGYAALFQTIGFQSETHMLKSFESRTWATYEFIKAVITFLDEDGETLTEIRSLAKQAIAIQTEFPIDWTLDRTDSLMIEFKGYEATYPESAISGQKRLKYDRDKPFTSMVPYYNRYKPTVVVTKPEYYVVPKAWKRVIEAMERNNIHMMTLKSDSSLLAEVYYIEDYKSRKAPWEGHYFHNQVEISKHKESIGLQAGDVLIPVNQAKNRYIVETLEPEATDSFFRWNFFDSMLQMKEGFSSYVFEDEAIEILKLNPELKKKLEQRKATDEQFKNSGYAQLRFIWMHTDHKEPSFMRYPIYRVVN